MNQRTFEPEHRLSRRDAAKEAFKDLLLEAYREREALLRGRVTLIPEQHDMTDARVAPSHADRPRVDRARTERPRIDTARIDTPRTDMPRTDAPRAERPHRPPHLREVENPRPRPTPRLLDITGGEIQPPRPRVAERDQRVVNLRTREAPPANVALRSPEPGPMPSRPEIKALASAATAVTAKLPATVARNLVDTFLPSNEKEADHDVALQRLWKRGLVFIAVFGGALGFWMVATTMSSAVIGPGQFVVDGSVKKVQHPTGGVVSQLLVREGDQVAQGDLLIRLDETVMRSNYQVVAGQIDELIGRKVRLEAERDGNDAIDIPPEVASRMNDPEVARIVAAERKLFQARRSAREGQRTQLTKRITQLQNEIVGLRAQLEANGRESGIIADELKGVRELFAKQLTPIMRLSALERQAVNLSGQKGQLTASIAQTEGKIAEIEQQILNINEDLRAETQKELREVQGKIAELSERRIAADDTLKRVEIRAPSSGTVHQLAVHTVGGVISAAEPAMVIVPNKEELIVEARITPQDRDQLQLGQKVVVKVHTSNQRNTPELNGTLTRIAADVSKESNTPAPYYQVWVTVAKSELTRLRGVHINAGMQVDVFIEAGSRSPLSYLLRPLTDQVSRAFRER